MTTRRVMRGHHGQVRRGSLINALKRVRYAHALVRDRLAQFSCGIHAGCCALLWIGGLLRVRLKLRSVIAIAGRVAITISSRQLLRARLNVRALSFARMVSFYVILFQFGVSFAV